MPIRRIARHGLDVLALQLAKELLDIPVRIKRGSDGNVVDARADDAVDSGDGHVSVHHQLRKDDVVRLSLPSKTQGPCGFDDSGHGDASFDVGLGNVAGAPDEQRAARPICASDVLTAWDDVGHGRSPQQFSPFFKDRWRVLRSPANNIVGILQSVLWSRYCFVKGRTQILNYA